MINKKVASVLFLLIFSLSLFNCKIVKIEEEEDDGGVQIYFDEGFDAVKAIDELWDSKLIPFFEENSHDIKEVLDGLNNDPEGTAESYSYSHSDINASYNFPVKGDVKVLSVNTESRRGYIEIDAEPYDGVADAIIQIGPIIKYTSLRDSSYLIPYGDFRNQLEFADMSNEINKRVINEVLSNINMETLTDKTISFIGAFTLVDLDDIQSIEITPIAFEIKEG